MLHRSSSVRALGECPARGARMQLGVRGAHDPGLWATGRYVHDVLEAWASRLDGQDVPDVPVPALSPLELADAQQMLDRAEGMGLPVTAEALARQYPHHEVLQVWRERTWMAEVDAEGRPVPHPERGADGLALADAPSVLWSPAPPEAVRGPSWAPQSFADVTAVAVQPDAEALLRTPSGELLYLCLDYKTTQGDASDSNRESDPQRCLYMGAGVERTGADLGVWMWADLRRGVLVDGQVRAAAHWLRRAERLRAALYAHDRQVDRRDLLSAYRPGVHCGACVYAGRCPGREAEVQGLAVDPATARPAQVWAEIRRLRDAARRLKSGLNARAKACTGPGLNLGGGERLGYEVSERWAVAVPDGDGSYHQRQDRARAALIERVATLATESGLGLADVLDLRASVDATVQDLSEEQRAQLQPLLRRVSRSHAVISKPLNTAEE